MSDKIIMINGRQVRLRVVPKDMIPTVYEGRKKNPTGFEFYTNPAKTVAKNTEKTYRNLLNGLAKKTGVKTCHGLVKHHAKVLEYMKTLHAASHGIFLSAIFYELNQPMYNKEDMLPYYRALQPIKLGQIRASIDKEEDPTKKEKLKGVMEKMKERYAEEA